ncbi:hypothetical protein MRX96_032670 [Rhipicephalus microplus]
MANEIAPQGTPRIWNSERNRRREVPRPPRAAASSTAATARLRDARVFRDRPRESKGKERDGEGNRAVLLQPQQERAQHESNIENRDNRNHDFRRRRFNPFARIAAVRTTKTGEGGGGLSFESNCGVFVLMAPEAKRSSAVESE